MARRRLIPIAVAAAAVLAGVLVAVTQLAGGGESKAQPVANASGVSDLLRGIPQRGDALGSPQAPVTVVEYADLQCPYCGEWARVAFPELVRQYVRTGKARIVFRGLAFVGPDSQTALRTVLAAGQQNRLWHVLELLYENQGAENTGWVTEGLLKSVGASVPGLDGAKMLGERSSGAVEQAITFAQTDATQKGVDSTPTFAVGRTGAEPRLVRIHSLDLDGLRPALDAALKQ